MRSVLAVCALGAGACLSTPPEGNAAAVDAATDAMVDAPDLCVDGDGDGWPVDLPGCGRYRDCADGDGARHPGALEADDGVSDLDCNGAMLTELMSVDDLDYSGLPNGGVSVIARHLDLEFDVTASFQLSSLRTTNGVNGELLFTGPMAEKWSGTNVWMAYFSTVATGTPVMQTVGGALFQWRVPFTSGAMIGASLYTVTIDGRVHRSDAYNVTADPAGAGHSITSYIALDATKFVDVTAAGNQGAPRTIMAAPFTTYFEPIANAPTWLCARTADQDVVWANAGTSGAASTPDSAGPRITSGSDTWGAQVALQYDWQFDVDPVVTGAFEGHFLLAPTFRAGGSEECGVGATLARGFINPALADVAAPGTIVRDDEGDIGVKDGYVEQGGYYLVDAGSGPGLRVTINADGNRQPPVASTWRIRGIPAVPLPVVERDGLPLVHGLDYRIQPDGTTGLWLVMMTTLANDEVLTLVVPRQT